MARSGFQAIHKAKKDFDRQQASFEGMRARDLRLINDGDSAVLWFIGCEPDEPREAKTHSCNTGGKRGFSVEICGKEQEDHEGCVYCHDAKTGDKRVKKATSSFYSSVADSRWVHKEKNKAESKSRGRDVFDWNDCKKTDDEPNAKCQFCRDKVPRERGGKKRLRLGLTMAIALDNLNSTLKKRCTECNGKVSLTGFRKGKKLIDSLDDIDEDEQKEWTAEYECTKCDNPTPGSIYACPIRMTRNGSGQTTTYSFAKEDDFQDQPEWVQELEPFDWDKVLTPRGSQNMADHLRIDNPFDDVGGSKGKAKRKKGADLYDDEEEEDDDDEDVFDDDEDEDEKPKKKAVAKRKPVEEEDEEEEDDDDEEDD